MLVVADEVEEFRFVTNNRSVCVCDPGLAELTVNSDRSPNTTPRRI